MPRLLPGGGWVLALLVPPVIAGAVLAAVFLFLRPVATAAPVDVPAAEALAPPPETGLLVHVTGAVAKPGIYRVARGLRVEDAITAAGGLSADADGQRLPNLAGRLKDGEQIRVPSIKGGSSSVRSAAVNLNSATAEELAGVPGFSTALAKAAVDYRSHYGGFQSSRELVAILGMGTAEYAQAKRYLRV